LKGSAAPLRVGIAGLGRMGRHHARSLATRTPGAQLVAAFGPTADERDWARRELGVEALYDDFAAMLRDSRVDAVAIVSPTTLHAEQTAAALEAGKHVFLEKPLALDVPTCERVMAVAALYPSRVATVGFVRRFDASYRQAKADIDAGLIGRPFLVRSQTGDLNDPDGFFVRFAPTSGGIFLDCSVHDIDVARWMLGAPKAERAFATGTIALHPGLAECGDVDNGLAIVEFEGGARAVFYATRTLAHGHEASTEIVGTTGSVSVGVGAHRDRVQLSDRQGVRHIALADFHERFREAFDTEMADFVAACRGEKAPALSLADATEATRIAVAITKSLHSGQVEHVL
jgi:myo-inositol 2-dehydrogenase/D-chiro-inositol 1-dehydrogenase